MEQAVKTKTKTFTKINVVLGMISAFFIGAAIFNGAFLTTPVSVTVNTPLPKDVIAPYVSIADPIDYTEASGEKTVTAFAYDNQQIESVYFYIDNILKKVDNEAEDGWTLIWYSDVYPDGIHILKAVAYDTSGNQHESQAVNITVKN